jgi:D-alanyl-lipoteichoic acid acyltransferase DltB (MBOAT superfamily)
MALDAQVLGNPYPWGIRWLALISLFVTNILELSIWGHKAIALCRMAGFNAFRMTYRPLTATSISEFFNRIHWYLKEMLATFFFYPTYLRYFKRHPRVRVFVATMAAAGLGNFIFHFLAFDWHVYEKGLWGALKSFHHYAVYCLILGTAIGISQIRILSKRRPAPTGARKVLAIAGVLLFYCLLSNFDNETRRDLTIVDYGSYFLNLFRP